MTRDEVKQLVIAAVDELLIRDGDLLVRDLNERTITHRLALYLERRLPPDGWDVDCEYNRDFELPKRLKLPKRGQPTRADVHARTVFPDIIIHRRAPKTPQRNLLVVEAKKSTNPEADSDWDLIKLEAFRAEFAYEVAAFLKLMCESSPCALIDFRDGRKPLQRTLGPQQRQRA
jgi:hypothetical protein